MSSSDEELLSSSEELSGADSSDEMMDDDEMEWDGSGMSDDDDDEWREEQVVLAKSKSYQVMGKKDVLSQSKELIQGVRELLSLNSAAAAAALLRHFNWNKEKLIQAFMMDRDKTLRDVGMASVELETPPPSSPAEMECQVCLEDVPMKKTYALGCGHRYCLECWSDFLEVKIAGGPQCVYAQCMHRKCTELCHEECYKKIVAEASYERYQMFLVRSFIDDNPFVKWCPAPGCDNSVRCDRRGRRQPVTCECGFSFCFRCSDADIGDHVPASCESVERWMEKNRDESENVKWMLANCKRCPKCKSHIEKNGGCMHMTCRKDAGGCGHEFCWLCRGDWKDHGSHTGGYYSCNKYDKSEAKTDDLNAEAIKTELDEYMFYFHRYNSHRQAMTVAQGQLKDAEAKGTRLQRKFDVRSQDTKFLADAADGMVTERRVLMWSYAEGYYLKKEGEAMAKEYRLFEYLQENVEKFCNALAELYEKDEDSIEDYHQFLAWKQEVVNITRVARNQLQNFVQGVRDGLTEEKF